MSERLNGQKIPTGNCASCGAELNGKDFTSMEYWTSEKAPGTEYNVTRVLKRVFFCRKEGCIHKPYIKEQESVTTRETELLETIRFMHETFQPIVADIDEACKPPTEYPLSCCRRCGQQIGWIGRFIDWLVGDMHCCKMTPYWIPSTQIDKVLGTDYQGRHSALNRAERVLKKYDEEKTEHWDPAHTKWVKEYVMKQREGA